MEKENQNKNESSLKKNKRFIFIAVLCFIFGGGGGYILSALSTAEQVFNEPTKVVRASAEALIPGFGTWVKKGKCVCIALLVGVIAAMVTAAWLYPATRPVICVAFVSGFLAFIAAYWYIPHPTADSSKG